MTLASGLPRSQSDRHTADALEYNMSEDQITLAKAADKALTILRFDHRFCANCFRQIREVERPTTQEKKEEIQDAFIGFAHPTAHTIHGVDRTPGQMVNKWPGKIEFEYAPTFTSKQICECGATHHITQQRPLKKGRATTYASHFSSSLNALREEFLLGSDKQVKLARKWNHSTDVLQYAVGHLKSQSEYQHRGDEIFKAALRTAHGDPDRAVSSADNS